MFTSVTELTVELQFLVSCGFMPNLQLVRELLPVVSKNQDILELRVPSAGLTALEWAAKTGNFEIAEFLANHDDSCGLVHIGAPVAWACYTSRVKLAQMLVDLGADSAATDDVFWNCTQPLMAAAENHQLHAMKWLVEQQGHDINMTDDRGDGVLAAIRRSESGKFSPGFLDAMRKEAGNKYVDQLIMAKQNPMAEKSDALKACATWARQNGALERPQMDGDTDEYSKQFEQAVDQKQAARLQSALKHKLAANGMFFKKRFLHAVVEYQTALDALDIVADPDAEQKARLIRSTKYP